MRKLLRYLVWLYLGYLVLAVLVLLPALNFLPSWFMQKQYGRTLATDIILFDPFGLALEIRGAALREVDGGDFASFDRAAVNLSLGSIWRPGIVLDELAVEGLNLHLQRHADGQLNIADLVPPPAPEPPQPAEPSPPPALTIDNLVFTADRIRVTDDMRAEPYSTHWDGLAMRVNRLSTVQEEGRPYELQLADESGGRLEWSGEVSLPEAYSKGRLRLSGVTLRPLWRFIKPWVEFELVDGRLDIGGNYRVAWGEGVSYGISDGAVSLTGLDVTASDPVQLPDTGIRLAALNIGAINLDGDRQQVQIGSVDIRHFGLDGWMEGDRISIAELLVFDKGTEQQEAAVPDPDPEQEASPSSVSDTAGPEAGWQVQLATLNLSDSQINWRSPFTEPAMLNIEPIDLKVEDIRWPATHSSKLSLGLQINRQAGLAVEGGLNLGSGAGDLGYKLDGLPLGWFAPNLPPVLNAEIGSGQAGAQGQVVLDGFQPQQVELDGSVEEFSVVLHGADNSLTRWNSLSWKKLQVDLTQQRLAIAQVHLDGYSGRVHIMRDGTLNIQQAFREEATNKEAEAKAPAVPESAAKEDSAAPWSFDMPAIFISDSEVDFMDESLPIVFRTVIGDLNGEITGVSSDPEKGLKVDIQGSVDGYAPVNLNGSVSPLRTPPALDLGLSFEGVDLARLTPYSGTYAGHAIDQGVLNVKVRYSLQDNHLKGDNKVVIDQLKLGKKIESEKALDLPLGLAIALLTDSRGIINLAVPVNGDVNSPGFSIGSVVAGAFVNLITKAVTAPFKLLAGLVGSGEDLQRVTFAAGTSTLDEVGQGKLADLATALKQRPKLKLTINGRLHPDADPQKLRQQQLRRELLATGLTEQDIKDKTDAWAAAISNRYAALPQPQASEEVPPLPVQARAVQASIRISPEALRSLAQERAAEVKRYLVNTGGMAADRAVIAQSDPADKANDFSGVEMSLDS